MKASVKVILSLAGVAGISYGAYRIYKWWKEEEALEAEGLSYEELVAEAEAKKIEEEMAERQAREIENERHIRELEGLPVDDEFDWFKTEDGFIRRDLTPYERNFGATYDPLTEECIQEMSKDGILYDYVQKLPTGKTRLYNYREKERPVRDIIESVEDMGSQIRSLKGANMEHDRIIYEKHSIEAFDYYKALVLDRYDIQDEQLRRDLIALFSWEFNPLKSKVGDWGRREDIVQRRTEHFGFGTSNSDWASVAEALLEYSQIIADSLYRVSTEQVAGWLIETIGLDFESDIDPVIHDTLISFIEHDRAHRPNADDTYGLFHIDLDQYNECEALYNEMNVCIYEIMEERLDPEFTIPYKEEDEDNE